MNKITSNIRIINNIPNLLKERGMTAYAFWQAIDGDSSSARSLAYKLDKPDHSLDDKHFNTMVLVAHVLEVKVDDLFTLEIVENGSVV